MSYPRQNGKSLTSLKKFIDDHEGEITMIKFEGENDLVERLNNIIHNLNSKPKSKISFYHDEESDDKDKIDMLTALLESLNRKIFKDDPYRPHQYHYDDIKEEIHVSVIDKSRPTNRIIYTGSIPRKYFEGV